jgi:hypothetical protein
MKARTWLSTSLRRQFPLGPPGGRKSLTLPAAQGERVSFQACLFVPGTEPVETSLQVSAPDELTVQARRVGCVPVPQKNTHAPREEFEGWDYTPGFVPDPLLPEREALVGPAQTTTFWITVEVPIGLAAGPREVGIEFRLPKGERAALKATILVSEVVLGKRKGLRVGHWFYADALCDWYKVEPFEQAFWPICEAYMRNYLAHGNDMMYVPIFTPPTDGVKRPTQLLGVKRLGKGRYGFDWRQVKRWVELARECGAEFFEWTHLFTQGGCRNAIRVYEKRNGKDILLWPPQTRPTAADYRSFLAQFLPAFGRFLGREGLRERSYFHLSDEPYGEAALANYRAAREMLRGLAPWMQVMDAVSDLRFAQEKVVDLPIPAISHVRDFLKAGIACWTYFCCGPRGRYINRHLDTPLRKVRMTGWVLYALGIPGFMHWGYNYWYEMATQRLIDPFTVSDGLRWPLISHGDTFVVYPGPEGPLDSIRWEVFAESLQDYALLETLGVDPKGQLLSPCKAFDDFPREERWLSEARRKLLLGGGPG